MRRILSLDLNNFKSNLGQIEKNDAITLQIKMLEADYTNCKFRLLAKKTNNTFVEQAVDNIIDHNNNLNIQLKKEFSNCAGLTRIELNIIREEEERTSKEFYFSVSNTLNKEIIDSIDKVETLRELEVYINYSSQEVEKIKLELENISYDKLVEIKNLLLLENEKADENIIALDTKTYLANEILRLLEEKINIATTSKDNLKTVIDNSSISKVNLSTVIETANSSKVDLESIINNSNIAKNELTKVMETSNTSKINLDNSNNEATTSKINLDTSTETANTSKVNLENKITEATTKNTELTNTTVSAEASKNALELAIEMGDIETIKEEVEKLVKEVTDARTDFWGKKHESLKAKEDSEFQFVHVDNSKGMFLEQKGAGSLTVKNTLEGSVRNLVIKGNTTGGYNSETSTSSALSSCGESENGIKVKTCGVNTFIVNSISLNAGNTEYHISGEYKVKLKGQISINNFSDKVAFVNINTIGGGYKKPLPLNKGKTLYTLQVDEEIVTYPYARKQDGWDDTNKNDLNKIMFSLGDISTDYEAYQESVVQVQLPSSMGSAKDVPNGSKDIVELSNTNVIQKCSSIILNDLNCTRISTTGTNVNVAYFDNVATDKAYSGLSAGNQKNIKADNKNFGLDFNVWDDATKINSVANAANGFWIFLNKSITDKSYFKENPTTIVYELKTHIIHELPNVGSLSTFRALTTVSVVTEVPAGIEGKFPVEVGAVLTDLQEENKTLKEENREFRGIFNKKMEDVDLKFARIFNAKI